MIDVIASFIQDLSDEARFVIQVAAPFVAALFLLIANPVWRWFRMHDPFEVTYLIPREKYREISFPGAESEEKTASALTVGIGYYRVMHLIIPKREIDISSVKLRFSGPTKNKPKPRGIDNPYWVDYVSSQASQPSADQYLNWEGEVYPAPMEGPLHLIKKDPFYLGNGVETTGPWEGQLILAFPIYKWRRIEKRLRFIVTDGTSNDIPFLEGERNSHGRHKETQVREDSKQATVSPNT